MRNSSVGGYQGLTLLHYHQQVHMDFGFMAPFEYVWEPHAASRAGAGRVSGGVLRRAGRALGLAAGIVLTWRRTKNTVTANAIAAESMVSMEFA